MGKLFWRLASGLGALLLLLLGVVLVGLCLRWAQVTFFYAPMAPEHASEKQAYLASVSNGSPTEAPNFVVIFFDDLGSGDLSSYGSQLIHTPRIDQAAAEGLRMTDFYSASPVCTPSRAALLTGRFPVRSGTQYHVFFPEGSLVGTARKILGIGNELPADEILLPEILGAAGYATGMIGKWHLGDRPGHLPNDFGFQEYVGVHFSNDMQPLHLFRNDAIDVHDETPLINRGAFRDEDADVEMVGMDQRQLTRRYTEEALSFLAAHQDERFFLYLAHTAPHVPHFADPEHAGSSEAGIYGDVVEDLDRSTGAVLEALDQLGLAENTLVLITSDNGADYNGSPGDLRGRKGEVLEGGQRVPMIARWPGRIPAGGVSDEIAMNIDVFPTILALAGIPLPGDRIVDGADLSDVFEKGDASPHELLFYFPTIGGEPAGARNERFKYLTSTGDLGRDKPMLSDLQRDRESHNLIRRFPEDAGRLSDAVVQLATEIESNPRGWR